MSTTMPQFIFPTATKPLVIVSANLRNQTFATRIWRVVDHQTLERQHIPNSPYVRLEELWSSKAPFGKNNIDIETNLSWSVPDRITPKRTCVALVQYNELNHTFKIPSILSPICNKPYAPLPQDLSEYLDFILNPEHRFSHLQCRAIYSQLGSAIPAQQLAQFLLLWPNANKENLDNIAEEVESSNYPSTIAEAYECFTASKTTNNTQAVQAVQTYAPPHPHPIPHPPKNAPYVLHNLQAVNFRTGRNLQVGTYHLSVQTIQESKHSARREVVYADAIPISPLKASVAVLYADINPESKTFNQPIIKSINTAKSTTEEITAFVTENRQALNEEQIAYFEAKPAEPHTSHLPHFQPTQPKGEFLMSPELRNCAECEVEFMPPRSSSRFCCEQCRVSYYSKSRRKISAEQPQRLSTTQPPQPQTGPSMEQFEALAAQVGQLVRLLTHNNT